MENLCEKKVINGGGGGVGAMHRRQFPSYFRARFAGF